MRERDSPGSLPYADAHLYFAPLQGVKVDKDHNACRACKKQNGKCSGRPLRKGPCDEFFVWLFKRLAQRNPRGAWFECDPYVTLKKDFNKETGLQVFDSAQQTFDITAAALAAARATAPAPAPAAPTTAPAASGSSSVSRRRRRHDAAENRRNGKKRAGGANDYNSDEDSIHGQAGDSDEE